MIDLHAMRTTLGTNLARAGVAPQIAHCIMRHGDYRTTLQHYTVLGLTDTAKAIAELPAIGTPDAASAAATGTDDADPQQYAQQCQRETVRSNAAPRGDTAPAATVPRCVNSRSDAGLRGPARSHAPKRANGLEPSTFSLEG